MYAPAVSRLYAKLTSCCLYRHEWHQLIIKYVPQGAEQSAVSVFSRQTEMILAIEQRSAGRHEFLTDRQWKVKVVVKPARFVAGRSLSSSQAACSRRRRDWRDVTAKKTMTKTETARIHKCSEEEYQVV